MVWLKIILFHFLFFIKKECQNQPFLTPKSTTNLSHLNLLQAMKTNALGFLFFLRMDKQNANGESLIYAKIRLNSQKAKISTKRYIKPIYLDAKKHEAKRTHLPLFLVTLW